MVFCGQCGQQAVANAKFCAQCGAAVMQATPAGRPGKLNFYEAFSAFDHDGSGTLTADELVGILTRETGDHPMDVQEARAFVAYFDTDGNGALDYDEFCTAMGQPGVLGTWVIPATLPDGPIDPVSFMSIRALRKSLLDAGVSLAGIISKEELQAKYRSVFVESPDANEAALGSLMAELAMHPAKPTVSRDQARVALSNAGGNVGKALQQLCPGTNAPPRKYLESMINEEGVIQEAVPVAETVPMMGSSTMNSVTSHTTVTGNSGPVNIVGGDQHTSTINNNSVQIEIKKEKEDLEVARLRHQMQLERERLEQLTREAERKLERQRELSQNRREDVRRREAKTNQSMALGATIGFFCAGPLGAAIGAGLGSKHAKKRIDENR